MLKFHNMLTKFINGWRYGFIIVMSFIYLPLFISCTGRSINSEYDNLEILNGTEHSFVSIVYRDTVNIDARGTSLQGYWSILGKQLSFADEHIVRVSMYDTLGHRSNSLFSQGRGPSEFLSPPLSFIQLESGKYLYSDKNQNLYLLSSEYIKEKHTNLIKAGLPARNIANFINDLKATPDPNNFAMYELCFQGYDFIEYNGNILFPVTTEHVIFNGYMGNYAPDFYKKSFTVMAVDTGNLNITNLLCKFPPIYHEKVIPNFKDCHLATDGNLLYVCFEADPNIYVLNEKFDMLGYFGEAEAEIIKDNFIETFSFEEASRNFFKHRKLCGHYGNLSCFGDYVFREFFLPGDKKGIQIYRNYTLVHTLYPVKEDFTMIGYIYPNYYAVLECDIDNEVYSIIKFELR